MKPPQDDRNARPRFGSALWCYVWSVIASATVVTVVAFAGLHVADLEAIARSPAFWLLSAPMAATALRPVVPNGRAGDGTFALVVFLFALLMHVGLAAAALLCVPTMVIRGLLYGQAVHRNLFNAGQHVLTLTASWGALRAFGIDPTPTHPWAFHEPGIEPVQLVAVGLAGLAYLAVNNGSVYIAISMIESRSLRSIVREDVRHLAVVGTAMVSLSPLVLVVMVHVWPLVPLFVPALASLYHNANLSMAREHDALHDPLTGLGNRQLLHREASRALDTLPKNDAGLALFVLDLDRFKEVNDTLGHAAGDRLLQIVAERLLGGVRPDDVVARLGGDEFVVLVHDVTDAGLARLAAVRLVEHVNGTFQVDGTAISLAVSLGVAVAPEHGCDFDALLRKADRAMYVAKAAGCGVAVFNPDRDGEPQRLCSEAGSYGQALVVPESREASSA